MNTNDLQDAIEKRQHISHPRFIDVSFVPMSFEADPYTVNICGYWFNERYKNPCSIKLDSIDVVDLDVWHITKA
mgnify:FL=1